MVKVYVDGACSGNPGPGGWAFILECNGCSKESSGHVDSTTNGRMELTATIKALEALTHPCEVELYSDAQYVVKGINEWLPAWKRRGWRRADKKPVDNRNLWERVDRLVQTHKVTAIWVQGHSGCPENKKCDYMAKAACYQPD